MTNDSAIFGGSSNKFDNWQSISVAILMALVGYTVMVSVPVLSTALVDKVGFTEEQVGRIWGADMGGFSMGAILSALLVGRVNRRHLVLAGVILCIGANALCLITDNALQIMGVSRINPISGLEADIRLILNKRAAKDPKRTALSLQYL